jgi:hypothetical protein
MNGEKLKKLDAEGSPRTKELEIQFKELKRQVDSVAPARLDERVRQLEQFTEELSVKVDNLSTGQARMEGKLDQILTEVRK